MAKVTAMEGGVGTVTFATGMAAIGAIAMALLKAGDHIVSSQYVFGNTSSMLLTMEAHGHPVSFVVDIDIGCFEIVEQSLRDSRVALNQLADGSVDMAVTGTADFGQILLPTLGCSLRLGDDFGSAVVRQRGTLQFP